MARSSGAIALVPLVLRRTLRWQPTLWLIAVGALLVRLYLAGLWLRFGMTKLEAGWLTANPVRALLELVANGQTPMPVPALAVVAELLLALNADVVLSVALPLMEVALAAAFLTGCGVRLASFAGIMVNTSLILGGLASVTFDGRIILLQALLLLAGGRAQELGVPSVVRLARKGRRAVGSLVAGTTGPQPRRTAA